MTKGRLEALRRGTCVHDNCLATQVYGEALTCLTNENSPRSPWRVSSLWDAVAFPCLRGQVGSHSSVCNSQAIPHASSRLLLRVGNLGRESTGRALAAESFVSHICRFCRRLLSLFSVLFDAPGHGLAFDFQSEISAWTLVGFFSAQSPPKHSFCAFYSI